MHDNTVLVYKLFYDVIHWKYHNLGFVRIGKIRISVFQGNKNIIYCFA